MKQLLEIIPLEDLAKTSVLSSSDSLMRVRLSSKENP